MREAFDWHGMMRVGLVGLHLRPEDFWNLTPAEFAVLAGIDDAKAPMNRARLADLARRFPDAARKPWKGSENDRSE